MNSTTAASARSQQPSQPSPAGSDARENARRRGFVQPEERTRTGRPTLHTPELVECICQQIRVYGISDSAAGLLAGIGTTTVSRWKQEDETFAILLGQARAQFDAERLTAIRNSRKRDGSIDWRAQVWLLQNSARENYGAPVRRPKFGQRPADECATAAEAAAQPSPLSVEDLELLQAARARATAGAQTGAGRVAAPLAKATSATAHAPHAARENGAILPETHAPTSTASAAAASRPVDQTAATWPTPQILPETPKPLSGRIAPGFPVTPRECDATQSASPSRNSGLSTAA